MWRYYLENYAPILDPRALFLQIGSSPCVKEGSPGNEDVMSQRNTRYDSVKISDVIDVIVLFCLFHELMQTIFNNSVLKYSINNEPKVLFYLFFPEGTSNIPLRVLRNYCQKKLKNNNILSSIIYKNQEILKLYF